MEENVGKFIPLGNDGILEGRPVALFFERLPQEEVQDCYEIWGKFDIRGNPFIVKIICIGWPRGTGCEYRLHAEGLVIAEQWGETMEEAVNVFLKRIMGFWRGSE